MKISIMFMLVVTCLAACGEVNKPLCESDRNCPVDNVCNSENICVPLNTNIKKVFGECDDAVSERACASGYRCSSMKLCEKIQEVRYCGSATKDGKSVKQDVSTVPEIRMHDDDYQVLTAGSVEGFLEVGRYSIDGSCPPSIVYERYTIVVTTSRDRVEKPDLRIYHYDRQRLENGPEAEGWYTASTQAPSEDGVGFTTTFTWNGSVEINYTTPFDVNRDYSIMCTNCNEYEANDWFRVEIGKEVTFRLTKGGDLFTAVNTTNSSWTFFK